MGSRMFNGKRSGLYALVFLACGAFFAAPLAACDIPVFRYALERWPAEPYQVVMFHHGELDSSEAEIVSALKQAAAESGGDANLTVRRVDVSGQLDDLTQALWQAQESPELPQLVVAYPALMRVHGVVWSGPLSMSAARDVMSSPAREEIAQQLLDGGSGVWVLIESGDLAKDAAAAQLLEAELAKMPERLTLPDLSSEPQWTGSPDDLQIRFSLLRISRTGPAEDLLRAMLLRSEGDLEEAHASEPIAFPVFGRGRSLYALVGRGINMRNIMEACELLVGPTGHEIKAENPGVDLLISAAWEEGLAVPTSIEAQLPLLTSVSAQASESDKVIEATVSPQPAAGQPSDAVPRGGQSRRVLWGTLIALGSIIGAVAVLSAVIKARSSVK